jgi:hypothetical protein
MKKKSASSFPHQEIKIEQVYKLNIFHYDINSKKN